MQGPYELVIFWSDENESLVVEVPESPCCMANGATCQEVVRNVESIIDEWIATAHTLGRWVPVPAGKPMYA